jgi:hypothetical protein
MRRSRQHIVQLLLLATSLTATPAIAQDKDWLQKLADKGVQIRKSFTSSTKDAGLPASFSYENPDQGPDYWLLDVGIKAGTYLDDNEGPIRGRLYPTLEFHRSSKEAEEVKKTGLGLTYEFERGLGANGDTNRMLFADGKIDFSRDSILDQTTRALTLRFGLYDVTGKYGPGRAIRFGDNELLVLRWLITAGVEDYRKLPIKAKVNGETVVAADAVDTTAGFGRANVELTPFAGALGSKLVLTATYTARHNLSGDDFFGKSTHLTEASADLYLDDQRRFSIGLSYQNGQDPTRNFLDEEFSSLGFKLKLGS